MASTVMDIIARDNASRTFQKVSHEADKLAKQTNSTNSTMSRSLRSASKDTDNFGKVSGRVYTSTNGHLRTLAVLSGGALLAVGAAAVAAGKSFVTAANDQRKANAQTAAVIKSTGGAAKVTAKHISDLSGAISANTGIMDDTVQASANMLLTFKGIRNEVGQDNDIFDQATRVVTDMSVALGQDGAKSAIQLGKALNDPIKGITALQRVGVTFTESQKATIRRLVETGHTLDAQKIILKELNSEFGGSAAAQATAGAKMKAAWDNVKESIGNLLLPALDRLAGWFTKTGLPAVQSFVAWIQQHWPEIQAKIQEMWDKAQPTLRALRDILINQIAPALKGAAIWAKDHLVPALAAVGDWISKHQELVKTFAVAVGTMMAAFKLYKFIELTTLAIKGLTLTLASNPITAAAVAITAIAAALFYAYKNSETFRKFVKDAFSDIKIWALEVAQWILRYVVIPVTDVFSTIVHGAAAAFGWVPGIGDKLKGARDAFDTFRKGVDNSLSGIKAQIDTEQAKMKARDLQKTINDIKQGKVPGMTANNEAGKAKVKDLQATINALKQGKLPNVTAENKNGLSAVATLQQKINEIRQGFVPGINADTSRGKAAIADMQAQIRALEGKTVQVKLVYDTSSVGGGGVAIGGRAVSGAAGGYLTGPGTKTSDSIPMWGSRGEFMVRAAAVDKYGLGFMENLNRMKFAAGGPIILTMPPGSAMTGRLNSITSGLHPTQSAGFGGGTPGHWSGTQLDWVFSALAATGTPTSWAAAILRRIMFESGGNPNAINLWDSNAMAGDPSRGLMQTIASTFNAYHQAGTSSNIYDPVANIAAAINYIKSRYGSIFAIDPPVQGYGKGGTVGRTGLAYLHRGETVVPADNRNKPLSPRAIGDAVADALSGATFRFDGDGLARLVTKKQTAYAVRGGRR